MMLTEDLRNALATEGTPLSLVDPATGERYVLVSAAEFKIADASLCEADDSLAKAQIPNARLLELARRHAPPEDWRESDEELF
jgi:hypothetical protein